MIEDTVVYPSRVSSSMWMNEGVVVNMSEEEQTRTYGRGTTYEKTHTWIEKKIWVRGKKHGKIVQPDPSRVTVLVQPTIRECP